MLSRRRPSWLALLGTFALTTCGGGIGPGGGTVSNNGASVNVPMGALDNTVDITIMQTGAATGLPPGVRAVGPVFVFGPEGQGFHGAVTITLPTTEMATAIYTRPADGSTPWVQVGGAQYHLSTMTESAMVGHFSAFVPTAPSGGPCNPPMFVCSGVCVDLLSDPMNCNHCGTSCGASAICSGGQCMHVCPSGRTWCQGSMACVDTTSDANNCAGCGIACPTGQICSGGLCRMPPMCSAPNTLCGGICTNLQNDVDNCGACGTVCNMLLPTCTSGMCGGGGCPGGSTACGGFCCSSTQTCSGGTCH